MGIIEAPKERERETPEIPDGMATLYYHFKRMRFGMAAKDDVIQLVARDSLRYAEIESYSRLNSWSPTPQEVSLVMDLDAIFDTREG